MAILQRPHFYGKTGNRDFRHYSGPYPTYANSQPGAVAASLSGSGGAYDVSSMTCCCGEPPPVLPFCCQDWCEQAFAAGKIVRAYVPIPGCSSSAPSGVLEPLGGSECDEWTGFTNGCPTGFDIGLTLVCTDDIDSPTGKNYSLLIDCLGPTGDSWEGFATTVNCPATIDEDVTMSFGPVEWNGDCNQQTGFLLLVTLKAEDS